MIKKEKNTKKKERFSVLLKCERKLNIIKIKEKFIHFLNIERLKKKCEKRSK